MLLVMCEIVTGCPKPFFFGGGGILQLIDWHTGGMINMNVQLILMSCEANALVLYLLQSIVVGLGQGENERVLMVGCTNFPDKLDIAVRRRFEKRIHIKLPNGKYGDKNKGL